MLKKFVSGYLGLLGAFIVLVGTAGYGASTGKISGTVTGSESGAPLIGANVIVTSEWENGEEVPLRDPVGAATDEKGQYFILNLDPGKYTIRVDYVGYTTEITTQVIVNVDRTTHLNFSLTPEAIKGETVTVTGFRREVVQPDLTATRKSYNVSEVEDEVGVSDISDILEMQSGVVDEHFRGGRSGEAKYLLSGTSIVNPLTNDRAFSPDVSGLEEVEVYTSGFSAEYGNAQSGVVNMVPREGKSRWRSRIEFAISSPYYKTWETRFDADSSRYQQGGSLYRRHNLDYFNVLNDTSEWLKEDPINPGHALFDRGFGFGPKYLPLTEWENTWPPTSAEEKHADSLKVANLARVAWLTANRSVGLEYPEYNMDYEFKFNTGGPISENMRLFFAGTQSTDREAVPTTIPEWNRQFITNLTYFPVENDKLSFIFIHDQSYDLSGFWERILLERELSYSKINTTSRQYGADWKHIFSKAHFMTTHFSVLDLTSREDVELIQAGELVNDYSKNSNWVDYRGPNQLRVGRTEDQMGTESTTTYQFETKMTSQVNHENLLKAGLQVNAYDVDVNRDENLTSPGDYRKVQFEENPVEGALFIQDKIDFEGLIANVGMRMDFYNFNTAYYEDRFAPLDRDATPNQKTQLFTHLEPRIGISFPVSEETVFHLNYGSFMQRPGFNSILYNRVAGTSTDDIVEMGNPQLKPQITNAYDVGIVKSIPFGFSLDISAYYKDVKDLIQRAFISGNSDIYATYINRDYADIKGFHIDLERHTGKINGYLRYNWEAATGKSSNALNAPVTYFKDPNPEFGFTELPDPQDIYLDFDRTHKIVMKLEYNTGENAGFNLFSAHPLGRISVNARYRVMSGRPYTWDQTGKGLKMNKRTPWEYDLRARIMKRIPINETDLVVYVEGYNLLNSLKWDYNNTFTTGHEAYTRWHTDREEVLTWKEYSPYVTSQEIYLLDNEPRHFRVGLVLKF
ncbi:MAG: TonB-dependent receptor [Candidatus Marinimicrobia bacterium]|nr:TonB-dependent receptor [Candidatus Neomarinimicrobiota bacterium]MCF7828924.1 TonB-dependent receptor [Candidatus Neomarinimicrobiota bacterium]MCF7879884.1 TonB-dependent receptor [Candidatus Neomarinimicrobiota bacterium]